MHQGVVGEHAIKLPSEGLVDNTSLNSGIHKWVGIHRVESKPRYLLIDANESMVHIIPKRAFPSVADAELFKQRFRQALAQSKAALSSPQ